MKKLLFIVALFSGFACFSQQDAWIYFSDKQNAQFYFDNPLEMLSQRALDRRSAQNIALDIKDVPLTQSYVDQVDAASGITILSRSKWLNAVHVRGFQQSINALANLSFVSSIDFANDALDATSDRRSQKPDRQKNAAAKSDIARQFDVQADFSYGNSANQIQMLNGQVLHQQDHTGAGKIIAIMDAGFPGVNTAAPFQRLFDNNLILGGYNFVDRDQNIYSRNDHGTLVLSTMGGYSEGQLVGTAPDAQYYLFITEAIEYENPLEESLWVEAAEMADSLGVDVINTSLGYPDFDNPAYNYSYEERDGTKAFISRGADIAFSRGMVVVVSGGNEGNGDDNHVSVPADALDVLSVGAVTASENYASFSSIGPTADGRVKPDVVAQGVAAVVSDETGEITFANGTSFSGPIIAGMVATFWSAVPELTNRQVVDFIRQSADLFNNPTPQKGYGVPDFSLALQNALSVEESRADTFVLWPNPVRDALYLERPQADTVALEVYDQLGQIVLKGEFGPQSRGVDCSKLTSGIYLYSLSGESGKQRGKFIKN
ncbi:S8 family serine peptidase [Flavobacterium selenitireducens]|uniref:S8 family serine peptidase n=1 Tax=Flavobacterium selenitireducens TaxID=2722704 RepID=UPI00168B48AA|nr:S8 family serine peptidase [Flavobacterium selenitireducens]MBD3583620.1 S8 family serine peptidase [Flavobacterium selenitireducens]